MNVQMTYFQVTESINPFGQKSTNHKTLLDIKSVLRVSKINSLKTS